MALSVRYSVKRVVGELSVARFVGQPCVSVASRFTQWSMVVVLFMGAGGCGDSNAATVVECEPGSVGSCSGSDGCVGKQECTSDGYYAPCVCNDPETVERTDADAGTSQAQLGALGEACSGDSDCARGALCLTVESKLWFDGAPTEGICVADCTLDESVCAEFDSAICVNASMVDASAVGVKKRSLCLPACEPNASSLSEPACNSVAGTLCEPLDESGRGFCRPVCSFDEQCSSGHCDRQLGTCVAEATSYSVPFGSACSAETGECDGVCLELSTGYSVCSERCAFGTTDSDCATYNETQVLAICGYVAPGAGLGDLGYCAEMCDCNDDCSHPDFVCDPFMSTNMQTGLGFVGLCVPPIDSTGQAVDGTVCSSSP